MAHPSFPTDPRKQARSGWLAVLLAALALCMLAPSAPARADSPTGTAEGQGQVLEVHPVPLTVTTEKGSFSFHIEVADEPGERSTGLMFRTAMPDNHGMLFVFQDNIRAAFWMMNTILPLDIIYIREDGTVDSIRRGVPFSLDALRSNGLVRYVLELNAGMAQKAGIRPGVKVVHPLVSAD